MRFNSTLAAVVLAVLGISYSVLAVAMDHTAVAEPPPDLSATEQGLDVWKATALLLREGGEAVVIDTRAPERFALYHLPGAINVPDAGAQDLLEKSAGKTALVVGETDAKASALLGEALSKDGTARLHFLKDGVSSWYLAYEIPVPLFNDKPEPIGYGHALARVKQAMTGAGGREEALDSVGVLARSAYEPTQLQGKKKATSSGAKKKISGGCGG